MIPIVVTHFWLFTSIWKCPNLCDGTTTGFDVDLLIYSFVFFLRFHKQLLSVSALLIVVRSFFKDKFKSVGKSFIEAKIYKIS